jgi:hypothetical protein
VAALRPSNSSEAIMATVRQCRDALDRLCATLNALDPDVRSRHVPTRTLVCRVSDLDIAYTARLDAEGVHDLTLVKLSDDREPDGDVRLSLTSDDLVALANGDDEFLGAWLRGRVHISASMRDMLRLRMIAGL